ncbi:hypothetical protein N7462_002430 [Penicillium macrosclerotiorum]|uniref:uncharacterized protein n=1 Tax=Penicillium macrosclerotiorum TaxID=303699 RepID=UPI0025494BA1|nr:uncharacterized protein N7462_002430 [Penicillium macrosclerotiorum]KAJ5693007.1 hypothetical protein N7462_002430 [Penicillium macrosclerotiorum]
METYYGHVRTPADAIILFEACRIGLLPRVQRRLSEKERQSIRSGSVFVWDEREAGMRRWTDGKSWSASRVSGSFLTYREMEGKRGGGSVSQPSVSRGGKTPESTRGSDEDRGDGTDEGPDGYRYKPDGLMKQSFSITTSTGQHLHLISYFSRSHPSAANLQQPSSDPALRHVRPQKGLYPESTVNDQQNLPVVTRGPMTGATYPITPHPMGTYARATHPPSYTPSYAWPPTPLATPPTVAVPYPGAAAYLPPVPASNGPPPAYSQPQHQVPPHQQPHHHALPPPPPQVLSGPYERPHPEPSMAAGLPAGPPSYPGRSPRLIHDAPHEQRSPRVYGHVVADNRMSSPRVPSGSLSQANGASRSPHLLKQTPPIPVRQLAVMGTPPKSEPNSVPGISSLMNSASLAPITSIGSPATGPGSPPNARASVTGDGPRDIPSDKIGFGGEDMRALRQLDRVFTA